MKTKLTKENRPIYIAETIEEQLALEYLKRHRSLFAAIEDNMVRAYINGFEAGNFMAKDEAKECSKEPTSSDGTKDATQ